MSNLLALLALLGAAAPTPSECMIMAEAATVVPAPGDADRARLGCEIARERFALLFGDPVPEVRVVLRDQPGYRMGVRGGVATVFWPTSHALAAGIADEGVAERHVAAQWRDVLPHEIAHVLLAARFFPDGASARAGEYGTPWPDWLDEGVAIFAESAENRTLRLSEARDLTGPWRDLRAILAAPHPATGSAAAFAVRDGGAVPDDEALWNFYPQAIAVLQFIYDAGGRDAMDALARRLTVDPADPEALAGLPGLPEGMDDVVAAWERWLAEH